jgi:hypothetical protein
VERPGELTVRSYRVVFELERRIHRIDRWRLPLPYGLPLRSLGYAFAALLAVILLSGLPLLGDLLGVLAPPLRLVVLPAGVAYALTRLRVDGRAPHRALAAWVRFVAAPRQLAGFRRAPPVGSAVSLGVVALVPDGREARYRRAVLHGPVSVVLRYPAGARAHGGTLRIRQLSARPLLRGRRLRLEEGQRLVVE